MCSPKKPVVFYFDMTADALCIFFGVYFSTYPQTFETIKSNAETQKSLNQVINSTPKTIEQAGVQSYVAFKYESPKPIQFIQNLFKKGPRALQLPRLSVSDPHS